MANDNKLIINIELDIKDSKTFNELKEYLGLKHNTEVIRAAIKQNAEVIRAAIKQNT